MADKKKDDPKKDAGKDGEGKKKGLPAIALIAIGACLGGAGVVFAIPPKKVEVHVEAPPVKVIPVQHPDLMEYTFNPRTDSGKAYASLSFYFVFEVREDEEALAFDQIKLHWDRAHSNCLLLLKARTLRELNSENGQRVLAKDLADELNASLFAPKDGVKVARVSEVLWKKWMIQ